jgi:hypothetical protein
VTSRIPEGRNQKVFLALGMSLVEFRRSTELMCLVINTYLRYVDLSGWHTNITVTILDTIHCPVFYLKLDSIGLSVPNKKHCLRYELNRLMLSMGL